jgi:hypothetical protein
MTRLTGHGKGRHYEAGIHPQHHTAKQRKQALGEPGFHSKEERDKKNKKHNPIFAQSRKAANDHGPMTQSKAAHRVHFFGTRALESIARAPRSNGIRPFRGLGLLGKTKSDSPVDSESCLGPKPIGLALGLRLPGPKQIGLFLGLGLWDPRPVGLWFGLGPLAWPGLGFGGRAPPQPLPGPP